MEAQNELNEKEIEILIEAVESWEKEAFSSGFNSVLIDIVLPAKNVEERKRRADEVMEEAEMKSSLRKETSVLLRSKLLRMKNLIGVETSA